MLSGLLWRGAMSLRMPAITLRDASTTVNEKQAEIDRKWAS